MANQLTGTIHVIEDAQRIQAKNGQEYVKQTLLLDCTPYDRYTGQRSERSNIVPFEFFGQKAELLSRFKKGDIVTVSFIVNSHEYVKKESNEIAFIVRLEPCKIEHFQRNEKQPIEMQQQQPTIVQQNYSQQPAQQGFQQPQPQYQQPQYQQQPASDGLPF